MTTHGGRTIGDVEIVALCDGVTTAGPLTESFPGASDEAWAETRERYPDVADGDNWRLHVHAFLVRSGGRTILVDTGVGPEPAPAFVWSGIRGALDEELRTAGVGVDDVDTVVITHVHDDHLGWNVAEGTSDPLFPNAQYLVHRADWEWMRDADNEEDRAIFSAVLAPLERTGLIDLTDGPVELTRDVLVQHAPGHTPGHQVVWIDSRDRRAVIAGDFANNPVMLLQPGVNGDTDNDPETAAATRRWLIERIDREARLVFSSHFPDPIGRLVPDGGRHLWEPDPV
jgi:glyoxylase-like metal-dependent hydrolase (beta-lactamase superfamily II)